MVGGFAHSEGRGCASGEQELEWQKTVSWGEETGRGGRRGSALLGLVGFGSVYGGSCWRISSREVM